MKKPQWITIGAAVLLTAGIYLLGKTVPQKKIIAQDNSRPVAGNSQIKPSDISIDSLLAMAKKQLSPEQVVRLNALENSISRGNVKDQQIHVYHQLARFWSDSVNVFEAFAWYEAEAARLENSEKTLTFAARLFLDNLQTDEVAERRRWKALQAKDLFERSLKIQPDNDSATVGLGACYLFGGIADSPMEGIVKIRQVVQKDSSNLYAQMMLVQGSLISGQYDKAISHLQTINRLKSDDPETILLLADLYERTGDKANAVAWYRKSLPLVKQKNARVEIGKRIEELSK